jgi:hypothetical protein
MTEDQLQAAQVKWFDEQYPQHRQMLFAVPNGGKRDKRTAQLMQATGVKPGVADLVLVLYYAVVFIENKVGNGEQSQAQIDFQRRVEVRGHLYFLLRTLDEFKDLMRKLIVV